MNTISIPDTVGLRRAVQEYGFALAATAIPSISGGNDGLDVLEVAIGDIYLPGEIAAIYPLPFKASYVGAVVLIGVFDPDSLLDPNILPEGYDHDQPVTFLIRITGEGDRAYSYEVIDPVLRLAR